MLLSTFRTTKPLAARSSSNCSSVNPSVASGRSRVSSAPVSMPALLTSMKKISSDSMMSHRLVMLTAGRGAGGNGVSCAEGWGMKDEGMRRRGSGSASGLIPHPSSFIPSAAPHAGVAWRAGALAGAGRGAELPPRAAPALPEDEEPDLSG